jgi:TnsA endonuclease N terminal
MQKDFMYWLEFDTDVLSYNTPGIAINYHSSGKEKSYTPDFQVVRYQKKQIIEVKSQKTVESEKYIRLYQMLSGLYDETGWIFVVLTESEIRREPILSNIKLLYGYARESFSIDEYRNCWEIARSRSVP